LIIITEGSSFSLFRVISIENVMQLEIRLDYGVIFAIAGSIFLIFFFFFFFFFFDMVEKERNKINK